MNDYTRNQLRKDIELSYTDKGEIEILISPGYGAGWSTFGWNDDINIALDKRIIDYYKQNGTKVDKEEVKKFLESIGYEHAYCGGWSQIMLDTIPPNCRFRIDEYDGYETLIECETENWYEL